MVTSNATGSCSSSFFRRRLRRQPSQTMAPRTTSPIAPKVETSRVTTTPPFRATLRNRKPRTSTMEMIATRLMTNRCGGMGRPASGGVEVASHRAVIGAALAPEAEDLLHGDHVLFHAHDLGDRTDAATAVLLPFGLNHHIDGRGDLLTYGPRRDLKSGHADHLFDTAEGVTRGIGVDRGHR